MKILHSRILGEGKPLLILHGYFGNGDNWKTIGNKLSDSFQVHLIDQRNHGRSFHSDEFDYELMVEDLHNYIKHYQLEKVHLLGHSMGADISPRMYPPHHQDILDALNSIDFTIQNTRDLVDKKLAEKIREAGVRQFLSKSIYWKEKGKLDFRFNLTSLTENNDEVGVALPSFTIFEGETLFLKGENSGYISSDEEPIINAHFPNNKIVTIRNAGHWLHAENPRDFLTALRSFL